MRIAIALLSLLLATCCPPAPAPKQIARPTPKPPVAPPPVAPKPFGLDALAENEHTHGFKIAALYLDGAGKPIGAQFIHDRTEFTLDYLRIESAPQGFIWVNSYPTSDKGEPHTQEHLLLGKGDRGRRLGSVEAMALAQSSAFTAQWRTAYHFHTVAGPDVFWPVFENQLDALLHPDYTDEEIRREVRNFGVDKGSDGKLRLEEKGTVYNEMVRSYESPDAMLWRTATQLIYGAHHPLSYESGGFPDAIRTMTAADIRKFHDDAYHLVNMGMIGAFPSTMPLDSVLDHAAALLDAKADGKGAPSTETALARPAGAATGTLATVEFPYSDTASPGPYLLAWPAQRHLDDTERLLLTLFLDAFAGDQSTTLYKQLIDSKTRTMDLGANAVFSNVSTDLGQPIYLGVNGVKADRLDEKHLADVRALVLAELEKIAKLPDGAAELAAFGARVKSRVTDLRRRYDKFLDTPPGFGARGTSAAWMDHLHQLGRTPGFKKSIAMAPALEAIDALLAGTANPWRDRIGAWGLLVAPYGVVAKPSPALRKQLDDARGRRIDDELARLQNQYGTTTAAATLARYQTEYDAATPAATAPELPPLVASPPMTLDDLPYTTEPIAGVPAFRARFDTMASTRVSIAFDLRAVEWSLQPYLGLLPELLAEAGVIENGKSIAADEVRERQRKEILALDVHFSENLKTGRHELVVAGAGNTPAETSAALAWMGRVILAPDWRPQNLPRLRDLVDHAITAARARMQGSEESWVDEVRNTWYHQDQPLHLHTESFLVVEHDLLVLRWELLGGDAASIDEATKAFNDIGQADLPRKDYVALAAAMATGTPPKSAKLAALISKATSAAARALLQQAGKDLAIRLPEMPDRSLAYDWRWLVNDFMRGLRLGPTAALERLEKIRRALFVRANARIVEVGSTANENAIAADLAALVGKLGDGAAPRPDPDRRNPGPIHGRATDRINNGGKSGFSVTFAHEAWGLLAPGTSSGVFLHLAPGPSYADASDDAVLDYLTSNLYTGHGAHSMFIKTWAAGLAYSNGLHSSLANGTIDYYAERCPLLPQTLKFVIDQLQHVVPDANIARYAVAQAFRSRIADDYETRAYAMAADLVDGVTPDVVRGFRTKIVVASKRADLADALFARMPAVYGKVLPGYGVLPPTSQYLVIGPQKQLDAYARYIGAAIPKSHAEHVPQDLYVLYPRDFWVQ